MNRADGVFFEVIEKYCPGDKATDPFSQRLRESLLAGFRIFVDKAKEAHRYELGGEREQPN